METKIQEFGHYRMNTQSLDSDLPLASFERGASRQRLNPLQSLAFARVSMMGSPVPRGSADRPDINKFHERAHRTYTRLCRTSTRHCRTSTALQVAAASLSDSY
ncbi:unnamed protein product [Arctia plantaginis]|uniref:Uncharacterized protein n=1 Tax=Arctia plantaginis TaxID=874455 RepID=A0A8S0ZGT6_ARCPL|nr:unnamed protein product [Arctia plantaginis]